jgi:peptide/nickel transport system permease protein
VLKFLVRRLVALLATLFVASFVIFASIHLAPGSPLTFLIGGRTLSSGAITALEHEYHLNEPLPVSYWQWLTGVFHGNLGTSIIYDQSVSSLITARLATTVFLVTYASIMILVGGIGLGTVAALRGDKVDAAINLATSIGLAIPSFVAAAILSSIFAVKAHWFPVFGPGSGFVDRLRHLTLPAICLALSTSAYVARITRTSIREEMSREHVDTARSRGIPESKVVWRHILRNAFIPIATVAGLTIASLIAATVVVETAFSLNGIGEYLATSIQQKDFPVVQAIILLLVTVFIVVNSVVDIVYALIDPRIELERGR